MQVLAPTPVEQHAVADLEAGIVLNRPYRHHMTVGLSVVGIVGQDERPDLSNVVFRLYQAVVRVCKPGGLDETFQRIIGPGIRHFLAFALAARFLPVAAIFANSTLPYFLILALP
jgi:hypothetical protein